MRRAFPSSNVFQHDRSRSLLLVILHTRTSRKIKFTFDLHPTGPDDWWTDHWIQLLMYRMQESP